MAMRTPHSRRFAVLASVLALVVSGWACSAGSSDANPVAPSRLSSASGDDPTANAVSSAVRDGTLPRETPPDGDVQTMDVTFPPRNEALQFRNALEAQYRDVLRRSAGPTFVDQEGTVVWAQEYLRYRVNLCPHGEAVVRVFRQIDGLGVQPICGTTSTVIFPPRNEPLDFMVQLEAKYRDGLRRGSGLSFVDVEGNIVWTQEYLRYRVSGCSHGEGQQKVFDQIAGRGVQPDCAGGGGAFTGSWRGTVRSTSCTGSGVLLGVCSQVPAITDTMTLTLVQNGSTVTGTINVGGFSASATGTATGNRLQITGRYISNQGITTSYENWDTSLSGNSMVGGFAIGLSAPGAGFARYTMTLSSVSRTARVIETLTDHAFGLAAAQARAGRAARER
jgi:hypothetical protein